MTQAVWNTAGNVTIRAPSQFGRYRDLDGKTFLSDISPKYADEIALSFGDTRKHVDALAIGPYFGTDLAADAAVVERVHKMTLDDLTRELKISSLPKAKPAANRDPRMGALYTRYLNDWAEVGGGLFMHELDCENFEGAGNWGALEHLTQPRSEAPKYDALQRFIGGK